MLVQKQILIQQKRILIMCFLSVRAVYELCQGELILDVLNYDYDYVFRS